LFFSLMLLAHAQEPDHEIHEELRALFRGLQEAINSGRYDDALPMLTEDIEATTITQEVISSRAEVTAYFGEWFGEGAYMRDMELKLEADKLTELSTDKRWGLVRGGGVEHYEANNGDTFDFATRWTAVVERGEDERWRLRAIHFGTNHLDNPVLTRVQGILVRNGVLGACLALVVGLGLGWLVGRRSRS
jgi:ketosteroid isomerase-like protein